MTAAHDIARLPDPLERIRRARLRMDECREEMAYLRHLSTGAVAELEDQGLSQAEIGRRLGVSRAAVNHLTR